MRTSLTIVAFVFVALAASCKKADPPPTLRSCGLSDEHGKTTQCFEWTNSLPREAQQTQCNELEVEPGGKRTFGESPCPTAGATGDCVTIPGSRSFCYDAVDTCKKRCSSGTFTPR